MAGFDGKTCPGCDGSIRGAYASTFNAMNRFGEPKMISKLWDAKQFHPALPAPSNDNPAIAAFHVVYAKLMQAMDGVVQDGQTIRWVPGVVQRITHLRDEWVAALVGVEAVLEEHWRDKRHSHGEMNVLRESRGSKHTLWGTRENTGYNHYVRPVAQGERGDIRHEACGNRFEIADHFKDQLRTDPTFYGKFWCPKCSGGDRPFSEVTLLFNLGTDL